VTPTFKVLASQARTLSRGAGRDKLLYLDAASGIAGDMLVAALIDLGVPEQALTDGLSGLALSGYRFELQSREHSGIVGQRFVVLEETAQPPRNYEAIVSLIEQASSLTEGARRRALSTFALLGHAEARVHGVPLAHVHFHEVGAVDSIVDIVAASIALDYLGARVMASPMPMGRGFTQSAHGTIPLPAPATLLCLQGVPTYDAGIAEELVTPTGAALVASSCEGFGAWPQFTPEAVGLGAGTKTLSDRPNVLRAILGHPETLRHVQDQHVLLEANIDDMTGELAGHVVARLLEAGALDAWIVPITMKKGRPALTLCALVSSPRSSELASVMLAESTSLGVRMRPVDRIERPRRSVDVTTDFGLITLKVADADGLPELVAPEYESCRVAAAKHGVALRQVYAAAIHTYRSQR
jgi:pyridinium-3,5-bisthiocarboxylic acid mononucleotide nickel chelatase